MNEGPSFGHRPGVAWLIALVACCATRGATAADPPAPEVEVFKAATLKNFAGSKYPSTELHRGYEGWVVASFMVDPRGKAYEISVVDSLGGAAFEKNAIEAIEKSTFEPAKFGGTAVDSASKLKLTFAIRDMAKGASDSFVAIDRQLLEKIRAEDKDAADALLPKLIATNLYEDGYRNLALHEYHRKWGTMEECLADLQGALAGEATNRYLGKDNFVRVQTELLILYVKKGYLADALETWKHLQEVAPAAVTDPFRQVMTQIEQLRTSASPIRLTAEISKGTSWFHSLLRRRFSLKVLSGSVSEIKLRCDKHYVFFRYDPAIEYTVSARDGQCSMEVVGDHATRFELVES